MSGTAQQQQQGVPAGRGETSGSAPLCPRTPSYDTLSHASQANKQNASQHTTSPDELFQSETRDSDGIVTEEEDDLVVIEPIPQVQDAPRSFRVSSLRNTSDERMSVNPVHEAAATLRSSITIPTNESHTTPFATDIISGAPQEQSPRARLMANMDGAIPENDGMADLRQKLQEIKILAISTEEKAQKMHLLMTQDYMKVRILLKGIKQRAVAPSAVGCLGGMHSTT